MKDLSLSGYKQGDDLGAAAQAWNRGRVAVELVNSNDDVPAEVAPAVEASVPMKFDVQPTVEAPAEAAPVPMEFDVQHAVETPVQASAVEDGFIRLRFQVKQEPRVRVRMPVPPIDDAAILKACLCVVN